RDHSHQEVAVNDQKLDGRDARPSVLSQCSEHNHPAAIETLLAERGHLRRGFFEFFPDHSNPPRKRLRHRRCRKLMRSFLTPCVIFRGLPPKKVWEARRRMRADRLLSIMLLLQTYRRMTAHDLADRLKVSERTILRDMESLSAAGVPVVAERGIGGGWSLLGEYRTKLTGLDEAEVQALSVPRSPRLLDDLGLGKAAEAAFIKLFAAVPSATRHDAESASQRIYVDVTGWNRSEESVPLLPLLQEAVWRERKLKFKYQR